MLLKGQVAWADDYILLSSVMQQPMHVSTTDLYITLYRGQWCQPRTQGLISDHPHGMTWVRGCACVFEGCC